MGNGQRIGTALCGLVGVPVLIISFVLNPGPGPNVTMAQMTHYSETHHLALLLGGWMQSTGTLLCVIFALALVYMGGAASRLSGMLTLFGSTVLMCVGLAEVSCYIATTSGNTTVALVANQLIPAVQHSYSLVAAPMVFLPLGAVILNSRILPRLLGYFGILLGAIFAVCGLVGMLLPIQGFVDALSAIQAVWWLASAIVLLVRRNRYSTGSNGSATA